MLGWSGPLWARFRSLNPPLTRSFVMKLHVACLALATGALLLTACGQSAQDAAPSASESNSSPKQAQDLSASAPTQEQEPAAPAAEVGQGLLAGTAVDQNLDPIPHLQLRVIHHQIQTDLEQGLTVTESLIKNKAKGIWATQVTTDDAGNFSLHSLAPGTYHLRSKKGEVAPLGDPQLAPDGRDPVMVQFNRTGVTIELSKVDGAHVHDATVSVQVQQRDGDGWTTTEELTLTATTAGRGYRGQFLGGERIVIQASHPEHGSAAHTVGLETLASGPIQLVLK